MPQSFPFRLDKASVEGPYNPFVAPGHPGMGDPADPAQYLRNPGVHFYRPWLASDDKFTGQAFVWPLGIEGFDLTIDPQLGIHKYIGDNDVQVDITHKGQENFTMTGNFPGNTGPANLRALRQIVFMTTPRAGKVLYVPHILTYAQRVIVQRARFSHADSDRGQDLSYEIEFVRIGYINAGKSDDPPILTEPTRPSSAPGNAGKRRVQVDSKHNTIRKIAAWKLGSASRWLAIYNLNKPYFTKAGIITAKVPDYRMPLGTVIYY